MRTEEALEPLAEDWPDARAWAEAMRLSRAALEDVTDLLRREVARAAPAGVSGNLRGSVFSRVRGEGVGRLRGVVASHAPYADAVEFGRRAGAPMPPWQKGSPLHMWVVQRLEAGGGDFESAAFLVARAIADRGTRGRYMFARAFEENRSRIERRFEELVAQIAERIDG